MLFVHHSDPVQRSYPKGLSEELSSAEEFITQIQCPKGLSSAPGIIDQTREAPRAMQQSNALEHMAANATVVQSSAEHLGHAKFTSPPQPSVVSMERGPSSTCNHAPTPPRPAWTETTAAPIRANTRHITNDTWRSDMRAMMVHPEKQSYAPPAVALSLGDALRIQQAGVSSETRRQAPVHTTPWFAGLQVTAAGV